MCFKHGYLILFSQLSISTVCRKINLILYCKVLCHRIFKELIGKRIYSYVVSWLLQNCRFRDQLVRYCHSLVKAEVLCGPRYPSRFILCPLMGAKRNVLGASGGRPAGTSTGRLVEFCMLPGCLYFACCCGDESEGKGPSPQCSMVDPPCRAAQLWSGWRWAYRRLVVCGVCFQDILQERLNGSCENW